MPRKGDRADPPKGTAQIAALKRLAPGIIRATALCHSCGCGYARGCNIVVRRAKRRGQFFEDPQENLETGRARTRPLDEQRLAQCCRIRGREPHGGDWR